MFVIVGKSTKKAGSHQASIPFSLTQFRIIYHSIIILNKQLIIKQIRNDICYDRMIDSVNAWRTTA